MTNTRKKVLVLFVVCTVGVVLQTGLVTSGCAEFYGEALLTSFDFCSVFNCTSGTFFNLCEPVALLADCPNITE
jgi:hypothetical protein